MPRGHGSHAPETRPGTLLSVCRTALWSIRCHHSDQRRCCPHCQRGEPRLKRIGAAPPAMGLGPAPGTQKASKKRLLSHTCHISRAQEAHVSDHRRFPSARKTSKTELPTACAPLTPPRLRVNISLHLLEAHICPSTYLTTGAAYVCASKINCQYSFWGQMQDTRIRFHRLI